MKREAIRLRPTGLWLVFGPVLGCMWLAAVNYSNNLVYAVLYLIGSLSFISIFHTWRNLAALRVEHVRVHSAFAGEDVELEVYVSATGKHPVYGLYFARLGEDTMLSRRPVSLTKRGGGSLRLQAGDSCQAQMVIAKKQSYSKWGRLVTVTPPGSGEQRGMYRFETLQVRSTYPFGLFAATFTVPVGVAYYVYPKPKGKDLWPELHPSGENSSSFIQNPGDDFSGVRTYQPGDPLRHVDWKAFARGRPLSVKQFTGGDGRELWLDAAEMTRLPLEERLSQLALWIVNAEKEEIPYALKLGRTTLPLGLGPAQSRRALETLAVAGMGSAESMA